MCTYVCAHLKTHAKIQSSWLVSQFVTDFSPPSPVRPLVETQNHTYTTVAPF